MANLFIKLLSDAKQGVGVGFLTSNISGMNGERLRIPDKLSKISFKLAAPLSPLHVNSDTKV